MLYTDSENLLEWRDWVDLSKIRVTRFLTGSNSPCSNQYSDIPKKKYIIYRTGGSWMNGEQFLMGMSETEKREGKVYPYIVNTNYHGHGRKKLLAISFDGDVGYVRCTVNSNKGGNMKIQLHSVVMHAFFPKLFINTEDPSKMITNHKGPKWDYRISELSVLTRAQNNSLKHRKIFDSNLRIGQKILRTGYSQGGRVMPIYPNLDNQTSTKKELDKIIKRLKYGLY